jgi:hypothetical protein
MTLVKQRVGAGRWLQVVAFMNMTNYWGLLSQRRNCFRVEAGCSFCSMWFSSVLL